MAKMLIPGVYSEEISAPNLIKTSIDTAVFIGYTEKHENSSGEEILYLPTKISSLSEFEDLFGFAQQEEHIEIIDLSTSVSENISVQFGESRSLHNLYYALQSFFDQGGKSCLLVSIGIFKDFGEPLNMQNFVAGLQLLENRTENFLINIPENQNLPTADFYILQEKVLDFCFKHRSFAILDLPKTTAENFRNEITTYRENSKSLHQSFGAVFLPNLIVNHPYQFDESKIIIKVIGAQYSLLSLKESKAETYDKYVNLLNHFLVKIPPGAAIAGAMIKNDELRGIWKAVSNEPLQNILQPEIKISTPQQESLNTESGINSVNCIREFFGKGILVWGNRTFQSAEPEFKYIFVRRFTSLIQNDIENALKIFPFKENLQVDCQEIERMITVYLAAFREKGAFSGVKPAESYFVKCGLNKTMTQSEFENGRVIVEVGMALIKPSEFIIVRIDHQINFQINIPPRLPRSPSRPPKFP